MLKYFFEDAYDFRGNKEDYQYLFDGMKIMESGERYIRHMGLLCGGGSAIYDANLRKNMF